MTTTEERESSHRLKVVKAKKASVKDMNAALDKAKKRGTSEQLISDLHESVSDAKFTKSVQSVVDSATETMNTADTPSVEPIECEKCSGFGQHIKSGEDKTDCTACDGTGYTNHKELDMAAKKAANKTSKKSKKNAAPRPAGRERKMLIRFSNSEYNSLQANAKKAEMSMAHFIRSKCGLL